MSRKNSGADDDRSVQRDTDAGAWGRTDGWTWSFFALPMVFLIVLATIVVLVWQRSSGGSADVPANPTVTVTGSAPTPAPTSSDPAPSTTAGGSTSAGRACPPAPQSSSPITAAPNSTWEPSGQVVVPSTPAGPRVKQDDGVRRCFDHSPTGATVFAATFMMGMVSSPDVARAVLQQQATEGQQQRKGLETPGTTDTSVQLTIAGFSVIAYSPTAAQVQVVMASSAGTGRWVSATVRLLWRDGDWKTDGQNMGPEPATIDSLAGVIPWAPGGAR